MTDDQDLRLKKWIPRIESLNHAYGDDVKEAIKEYRMTAIKWYGYFYKVKGEYHFWFRWRVSKKGLSICYKKYKEDRLFDFRNKIKSKKVIYFWRFQIKWGRF